MTRSEFTANRELYQQSVHYSLKRLAQLQALHGALRNMTPRKPAPAAEAYAARQRIMRLTGFDPYNTAGSI